MFAVHSAADVGLFFELLVLFQDESRPLLKQLYVVLLVFHQSLQLLQTVLCAPPHSLQGFLLSFNDGEAQLLGFHEVLPEVLPKPLLKTIDSVISEDILFYIPVIFLKSHIILTLQRELSHEQTLYLENLISSLEFFAADAHAAIIEKLVIRVEFSLSERLLEELRVIIDDVVLCCLFVVQLRGIESVELLQLKVRLFGGIYV